MAETRDPLAPCSDHGCVLRVEPSTGMGTNGGCRCLEGERYEIRQLARRLAADRRRMAEALRAADALAEAPRVREPGDGSRWRRAAARRRLLARPVPRRPRCTVSDDAIERARRLVALDCATCDCDWSGEACRDLLSRDETATLLAALDASRREVERLAVENSSMRDMLRGARDHGERVWRRAALEEAIEAARRVRGVHICDRTVVLGALRALLDQPVRPAPDTRT